MDHQPLRGARVALLYSPGHIGVDYASSLLRGIERGFFELGARVATLNYALYRRSIERFARTAPGEQYPPDAPLTRGIVDFMRDTWPDAPFDLCFGLFQDIILSDELVDTVRRRSRKVVQYPLNLLDQPQLFDRGIRFCDETFCSEEGALESLRATYGDSKIRYMPMAADPYIHRRLGAPKDPRLLFVGSMYADRHLLLEKCAEEIDVSVYGGQTDPVSVAKGFARESLRKREVPDVRRALRATVRSVKRDKRILSDEEFVRLASEHGVSVGFSAVWQTQRHVQVHKVRLREYEATMTGMCHLAKRLPELERGFEDGREIVLYDDEAELPEILRRVRSGAIDWRGIGERARARAERDHTWARRLAAAFASA